MTNTPDTATSSPATSNPAKDSLRQEQKEQRENGGGKDGALSDALEDTFPASDPLAVQSPTKPGAKKTARDGS